MNFSPDKADLVLVLSAAVLSEAVLVIERRHASQAFTAPSCRIACCQGRRGICRPTVFEYDYEHRCAEHEQEFRRICSEIQPLNSPRT